MNFCPVSFLARWFGLATFVTAVMSAAAQETIQFTKPVDQDLPSKTNAFRPTSSRNSAGSFNAPSPLFGGRTPTASFDVLPGSPGRGAVSAAEVQQWQKILEGKKNWALMTPEEILGVRTPEEIMGIPDPKNDPKLSAEERFLQRRDRLSAGATNGYHRPDASWRGDFATDLLHPSDASSQFAQNLGGSIPGASKNFNPLFNLNPDSLPGVNQKSDSAWANPFGMPEPLPKPTPEQLAGMDRFRALMEPSALEKTPEPSRFSYQPAAAPDPNLQTMPAFNPNGRSFTPLESGISRPTGLTPLPGITGPHLAPAKKTASLVETPPWLSDSPQAFTPLKRQF